MIHKLKKPFASLKFPDFKLYYSGTLFSEIGSQMQVVAINWQVYELTHSAVSLGIIGFSAFLAIILFALPAGLLADKADRKKILIFSQLFPCFLSILLTVATITQTITPLMIYILVFLNFAARTFQGPARQSIIPQLVPKPFYVNAFSLQTMARQISLVVGPAIAGFMIEFLGVGSIYLFNSLSFVVYIFTLLPLKIKPHQLISGVTYSFKSIWEGIKFVTTNEILFYTMFLDFLANFFSAATTLLPIFAKDIFAIGPKGLGLLYAAPAIGSTIAGLIIASFSNIKNQGKVILGSVMIYGAATAAFGISNSFYIAIFFLTLMGVGDMISTVLRNTLRQLITPDHLRGRMIAVNTIFVQGGPMIGETESGFVAAIFGAPFAVFSGGVITVLVTILIYLKVPKLRNYQSHQA